MELKIRNQLSNACATMLRPVVSVLIKSGITWKEFSDLSKRVFVDVATDEFGISRRPTNVSRVSVLTGLTRKEVNRQRGLIQRGICPVSTKMTEPTRLMIAWNANPTYLDCRGAPLALPRSGPAPSFQSLYDACPGSAPVQTLIKELLRAGTVQVGDNGKLVAIRVFHMPVPRNSTDISCFFSSVSDHANKMSDFMYKDRPVCESCIRTK